MTITDAVVPVAGLGTRLLPATKSQPKEMLPVAGKPVVQHVVEELSRAGVDRLLFVTGRGKSSIEDHFDIDPELIRFLRESGREELLSRLDYERLGIDFLYTRQLEPRGLANAVLCAERFAGASPFVLALGDSIIGRDGGSRTVAALTDAFSSARAACALAVEEVPEHQAERYGVVEPAGGDAGEVFAVAGLVEKPDPVSSGRLAIAGRYVLSPAIFDSIRATAPGHGGEVQLTDAIRLLLERGLPVVAVRLPPGERRYDAGALESYCETFIEFALTDPRLGGSLRERARALLNEIGPG